MKHLERIFTAEDANRAHIGRFRSFIEEAAFPCVGAKSALQRGRVEFEVLDELGSKESAAHLCARLAQFSADHPYPGYQPISFVAIFRSGVATEDEFHDKLWTQLQAIHDLDAQRASWAADVSSDPRSSQFSFSIASRAFFVVGLHPGSSRLARQAPQPTLVFNFHSQFEALRAVGRYQKLQTAIRERDVDLQGYLNPMLARFGEASEALQYSGRADVDCPFRHRSGIR